MPIEKASENPFEYDSADYWKHEYYASEFRRIGDDYDARKKLLENQIKINKKVRFCLHLSIIVLFASLVFMGAALIKVISCMI